METAFDLIKVEKAKKDDLVAEFTRLYRVYVKACAWMERHRGATVWDRQRFYQLGRKVELGWGGLSDEQRSCALVALCADGVLPGVVLRVLEIFNGRVVEVIA